MGGGEGELLERRVFGGAVDDDQVVAAGHGSETDGEGEGLAVLLHAVGRGEHVGDRAHVLAAHDHVEAFPHAGYRLERSAGAQGIGECLALVIDAAAPVAEVTADVPV